MLYIQMSYYNTAPPVVAGRLCLVLVIINCTALILRFCVLYDDTLLLLLCSIIGRIDIVVPQITSLPVCRGQEGKGTEISSVARLHINVESKSKKKTNRKKEEQKTHKHTQKNGERKKKHTHTHTPVSFIHASMYLSHHVYYHQNNIIIS